MAYAHLRGKQAPSCSRFRIFFVPYYKRLRAMKKLPILFLLALPCLCFAQDTAKVAYGDARYMAPAFKTKNNFQVYDIRGCEDAGTGNCPPDGVFVMYGDSAMKRKLYTGNIANGRREGVWSYMDKQGNTVCEEEYSGGRLIRYTLFKDGAEVYEKTAGAPLP